ncbi:carboxylate-amine ligase, YbdK family [Halovivax ruber XH-70]|uniref:Glutamate--cysteine ligase n=1 Tax=Halovivax ruber (strain DSM 18193 / JCM 13892 / XH-70) TaxID=797302 RepID=L0IDI6_HALRX|nr:glutamate--cysteine ligase [Halovivax ruber]AGB16037.1 carboxylate-amine ligase, YbdK family [Halovivax ruber XH-70]
MDRGSPSTFDTMGTLGVEEECYVVDAQGRPTSGTDELVYESDPPAVLEGRLDHELFKCVIETQTPTFDDPDRTADVLESIRSALCEHANDHGFAIAAAGLHPLAKWRELEHAEKPRYQAQLDRIQYPQHRNTTAGVHVHVGVDDPDKAIWIANELRWYVPIILALSANSPIWNGFDTGLASARAKIFEGLPNTGMPTFFEDYEAFDRFERRMVERGAIDDRGELWYDVRPHTGHGTVEIRTPDGQVDPTVISAFVEYCHALVCELADAYEDGERGYAHLQRRELLDENKWRAIRHGHDATLMTRDMSGEIGLGELVDRECERLDVGGLRRVYETDSGAERQRHILADEGVDALCASLMLDENDLSGI